MDHRTSSEAFNQTCSQISPGSSVSDVSQQTTCVRRQRTSDPCPGSQPDNPERIFVLRNCNRCPDYTVTPCQENQCPVRSTNFSGECPSCSTNCPAAYPSQDRLSGEKVKPTKSKPPKPAPERKQRPKRPAGGTNMICPLCGQVEIPESGQTMCPHCNERIHSAVNNYIQCHCYPTEQQANSGPVPPTNNEQPANGQQVKVLTGDPNLNVIVLQDCQNKQELFDQLAMAMNRNGGQVQNSPPPCYPGNGYNQNNANNFQSNRSNYQNHQLPGYNEYGNYVRGYEEPQGYDYRYDMGPGQGPPSGPGPSPGYYPETYDDDRYNKCECPIREARDPYPELCDNDFQDQNMDRDHDCSCPCTCNCEFCRQGFETKENLATLLAQALEIFVQGYQESRNKKPKKKKKKPKNKNRKSAGSTDAMPEDPPSRGPKQSRPWRPAPGKHSHQPYYPRKRTPPQGHILSQAQGQVPYCTGKITKSNAETNSQANLSSFCSNHPAPKDPSLRSESFKADGSKQGDPRPPTFFLPNCEELRSSHDPENGSRFGGGGYSRRRRRARRRARYQNQQQQAECNQAQLGGEDRRSQAERNGCAGADQNRTSGGAKNASVLLGLSPIAHYRPGMMKFPVNYLLAGTNYRRSLVRTAAGVTLHQKPYMDKAEVKDLPHFPRQESSHLECRAPPAKQWL